VLDGPDTDVSEEVAGPTRVDDLSELQTIILNRVGDEDDGATEADDEDDEDDEPTMAEEAPGLLHYEKTQPLPAQSGQPTTTEVVALLHHEKTQPLPAQSGEPSATTARIPLPPGYPGEDDEATKLDTRMPPLAEEEERTTLDEVPLGVEEPTNAVGGLRLRNSHIVALALVAIAASVVTWFLLAPEPPGPERAAPPRPLDQRAPVSPDLAGAPDVAGPLDAAPPDVARRPPDALRPSPDKAPAAVRRPPRRPRRRPRALVVSEPQATLRLSTDPAAQVFLGRRSLGRTPLKVQVPSRPLTLRFRNSALGLDASREVHPRGTSLAARFVFRKGRLVFALPAGLRVKLDGRVLGRAPLAPVVVYEGRHVLEVGEGGGSKRRRVEVSAGKSVRIDR